MSWYEFGHHEPEFLAYLPDNKKPIDTGFYYQELISMGGWYFAPIPGSGQRRFYNRLYISPSKKEIEQFNLDQRAAMFIQLGKTHFGQLEFKITDTDLKWDMEFKNMDDEIRTITDDWHFYYDYIAEKVKKSYIVVHVAGRSDTGDMFKSKKKAVEYAEMLKEHLTPHIYKKYGIQVYKPHTEKPFLCLGSGEQ